MFEFLQQYSGDGTPTRKIGSNIVTQIWHSLVDLGKNLVDLLPKRSQNFPKHKFGAAKRPQICILLSLASFGLQINQVFTQPSSFSILLVLGRPKKRKHIKHRSFKHHSCAYRIVYCTGMFNLEFSKAFSNDDFM